MKRPLFLYDNIIDPYIFKALGAAVFAVCFSAGIAGAGAV